MPGAAAARALSKAVSSAALACALVCSPAFAETAESSAGFEDFAASGGVMKAEPSCFANECGDQSKACFTNPSCLKGITCLGNCRGEQLCATRCFARFGSEKLNSWLSCTLEEHECVSTGVKQDTSAFYADPPPRLESFAASDLDGKWWKVLGYSAKYDLFPCQVNTFESSGAEVSNDILFRVPKPEGAGFWQNNFLETMRDARGPEGKASLTVEGKMYGLTFHEQWYVLGQAKPDQTKLPPYLLVAYKGDTQQGPYDGAFVYTRDEGAYDASPPLRAAIAAAAKAGGLEPAQFKRIDNSCPADGVSTAGASSSEQTKDKLEWKDIFDLAEWFRPGTLAKQTDFDPNKM